MKVDTTERKLCFPKENIFRKHSRGQKLTFRICFDFFLPTLTQSYWLTLFWIFPTFMKLFTWASHHTYARLVKRKFAEIFTYILYVDNCVFFAWITQSQFYYSRLISTPQCTKMFFFFFNIFPTISHL